MARERIDALIDQHSIFRISALAGEELYDTDVPSGGIITGIGTIHGRP